MEGTNIETKSTIEQGGEVISPAEFTPEAEDVASLGGSPILEKSEELTPIEEKKEIREDIYDVSAGYEVNEELGGVVSGGALANRILRNKTKNLPIAE